MEKRKALKFIDSYYYKIKSVLECQHFGEYHNQFYNLIRDEEKQHRHWKPEGINCGLTIAEATKYFYVRDLIEAVLKLSKIPDIKEVLHLKPSYVFCHTLALNYEKELKEVLQDVDIKILYEIDYAELMK